MTKLVAIRLCNVVFYLKITTQKEWGTCLVLRDRISKGEKMRLRDIANWCKGHSISYTHKFIYRKDIPLSENMWNLYWYIRFQIEEYLGNTV